MDKQNFILITVDALRFDKFEKSVHKFREKPYKVIFKNAYANGCGTPRAFNSIMCSSYPLAFNKTFYLSKYETTIAEVMKNNGYKTFGFNAANPFVSRRFGYNRGFDFFEDYMEFKGDTPGKLKWFMKTGGNVLLGKPNYPRAKKVFTDTKIMLSKINNNAFFLWLHLMDTHQPCLPPIKNILKKYHMVVTSIRYRNKALRKNADKRVPKRLLKKAKEYYNCSADYLLKELFSFCDYIYTNFPDSWIVILADHGEAFGEDGIFGHPPELREITLHVPLMIIPPEGAIKKNIEKKGIFSIIDLLPTLLYHLKLEIPKEYFGKPFNIFNNDNLSLYSYSESLQEDGVDNIEITEGSLISSFRYKNLLIVQKKGSDLVHEIKRNTAEKEEQTDINDIKKFIELLKNKINEKNSRIKLRKKLREIKKKHK